LVEILCHQLAFAPFFEIEKYVRQADLSAKQDCGVSTETYVKIL
jgi:hypothetical protein